MKRFMSVDLLQMLFVASLAVLTTACPSQSYGPSTSSSGSGLASSGLPLSLSPNYTITLSLSTASTPSTYPFTANFGTGQGYVFTAVYGTFSSTTTSAATYTAPTSGTSDTITLTDSSGTSVSSTINLSGATGALSLVTQNPSVASGGAVTISVQGGIAPYTFSANDSSGNLNNWGSQSASNNITSDIFTAPTGPDTVTITVNDSSGSLPLTTTLTVAAAGSTTSTPPTTPTSPTGGGGGTPVLLGLIDAPGLVPDGSGNYYISGWVCVVGSTQSITVSLNVGADQVAIGSVVTSLPGDAGVYAASNCNIPASEQPANLRFRMPVSSTTVLNSAYLGQPISMYANASGAAQYMLISSGSYYMSPAGSLMGQVTSIGWVASASGGPVFMVQGWACTVGSSVSLTGSLTITSTAKKVLKTFSLSPMSISVPGTNGPNLCNATGTFGFAQPITGPTLDLSAYYGATISVAVAAPTGGVQLAPLSGVSSTIPSYAGNTFGGELYELTTGNPSGNSSNKLTGYACMPTLAQSVLINVYAGTSVMLVTMANANFPTTLSNCKTPGFNAYMFAVPLDSYEAANKNAHLTVKALNPINYTWTSLYSANPNGYDTMP